MQGTKLSQQEGELGQLGQSQTVTSVPATPAAGPDEQVEAPTNLRFKLPDWAYDPALTNASIQRGYQGSD